MSRSRTDRGPSVTPAGVRPRLVAGAAGLVAVAIAVLLLFSWPELARRHHLRRLQRSPAALRTALDASPRTPRGRALAAHARTEAGARALLRVFLEELAGWNLGLWPDAEALATVERGLVAAGGSGSGPGGGGYVSYVLHYPGRLQKHTQTRSIPPALTSSWRWLGRPGTPPVSLEILPGLRFSVLPLEEAEARAGLAFRFRDASAAHLLYIEQAAPEESPAGLLESAGGDR